MKKFPKIIAALLLVSLLCGIVAVSVAATSGSESVAQTNQLKPSGAVNLYALDFDKSENTYELYKDDQGNPVYGADFNIYRVSDNPGYWEYHENVDGTKSLALVYDGKTALKDMTANGTQVYFSIGKPTMTDGVVTKDDRPSIEAGYSFVTYEFDIGTDAYALITKDGTGKITDATTYTLKRLAELEVGSEEDKALAAKVKAEGVPAYTALDFFGPVNNGYYMYQNILQAADGRWYIKQWGQQKGIEVYGAKNMYLSNEVGVYDHLTYVYDLGEYDAEAGDYKRNAYLHVYLNGEKFITYATGVTGKTLLSAGSQYLNIRTSVASVKEINGYTSDCYSMVIDNYACNAYENGAAGISTFFENVDYANNDFSSVADLLGADGLVWNAAYVYGDGSILSDRFPCVGSYSYFDPISENQVFSFQSGFGLNFGTPPTADDFVGIEQGQYIFNGNKTLRVHSTPTNTKGDQLFLNLTTKPKAGDISYYVHDFDFTSDVYYYNEKYYTVEEVAALEETDPDLALDIMKNGKAAYPSSSQFGAITGYGIGASQAFALKVGGSKGVYKFAGLTATPGMLNSWLKSGVTLSDKVGEYNHFTAVFKVDHDNPANSAVYYIYNGEVIAGAVASLANLNSEVAALQVQLNGNTTGSFVLDNINMRVYPKRYTNSSEKSIDNFFSNGFITEAKTGYNNCYDVVYDSDYIPADGNTYVSLDNVNKLYKYSEFQSAYDALQDGGTVYISGVNVFDFEPSNATEFTVVASNGARFTPSSRYEITETVEDAEAGTVTYSVVRAKTMTVVWYLQGGEKLLYEEECKKGTVVGFKPSEVIGGVSQYAYTDLKTGSIKTLTENSKFTVNYVEGDVFDEATGTITDVDGYLEFVVDYDVEYLPFVFFDANGEPIGNEASYGDTTKFKTLYTQNTESIATIKFFGNGEDVIYINMMTNNSFVVNGKTLTVDLNGQRVWFGAKKDDADKTLQLPMFKVQNGATLNIINGHLFHVTRYIGASWAGESDKNIYTPVSFVAVENGASTVNFGVKGDNKKALNFYGSSILKVLAGTNSVKLGIYGGLIQSDNFLFYHPTWDYGADGIIDIRAGEENTVEILDSTIIDNTSNAVFNLAAEAKVTTTVTNSTVICKTINKNGKQPLVAPSMFKPTLFKSAAASGTTTFVNSTIISPAHVGTETHKVILEAGTKTNWAADSVKRVAASGLSVVLGSQAYSASFFMAENFQPIHNSLHGNGKSDLFDVDLLSVGYMNLGNVAYTDTIKSAVVDESEPLPEGVTYVIYQDANGNEVEKVIIFIGSAPVHPEIAIATQNLDNGWYDIGYKNWKGDAVVAANSVYVPDGEYVIAKFVPTAERIKVGAQIQGHMSFDFYVLDELENIDITYFVAPGITPQTLNDGKAYIKGTQNINSTKLGFESNITIKYMVTLESGYKEEVSVSVHFKSTSYFDSLVNAVATGDKKYGTGWEKSLAAYLQYRYYSYLAAGIGDFEDAKKVYEGYFVTLKDYLPDLTAELPQLDIDKKVEVDKGTFADYIVAMDYDVGQNQPNAHFYLDKAKIDALYGEGATAPFIKTAYPDYGLFADTAFTYKTVTPTVSGSTYEEQSGPQQFFILGTTNAETGEFKINTYTVKNAEGKDVVCYRARIIQGEAACMRATFEFTLKAGDTTLVGTFSLREYANALDATDADPNLKATIKLLYISAVESWNYKVKTVSAN